MAACVGADPREGQPGAGPRRRAFHGQAQGHAALGVAAAVQAQQAQAAGEQGHPTLQGHGLEHVQVQAAVAEATGHEVQVVQGRSGHRGPVRR